MKLVVKRYFNPIFRLIKLIVFFCSTQWKSRLCRVKNLYPVSFGMNCVELPEKVTTFIELD